MVFGALIGQINGKNEAPKSFTGIAGNEARYGTEKPAEENEQTPCPE